MTLATEQPEHGNLVQPGSWCNSNTDRWLSTTLTVSTPPVVSPTPVVMDDDMVGRMDRSWLFT